MKKNAISLKKSAEQSIIESSVKLHLENKRVLVRDPVQPLIDKHRGNLNIHQALRVFKTQCTNGPEVKEKVKIAHSELIERNVMTKLLNLPENLADLLTEKHWIRSAVRISMDEIGNPIYANFSLSITNYH